MIKKAIDDLLFSANEAKSIFMENIQKNRDAL